MLETSKITKVNVEILHYQEKLTGKDIRKDFKKRIKKLINSHKSIDKNDLKKEEEKNEEEPNIEDQQLEIDINIKEMNTGKKGKYFQNLFKIKYFHKEKKLTTYCIIFQAFGEHNKCFFDCSNFPETNISVEVNKINELNFKIINDIKELYRSSLR